MEGQRTYDQDFELNTLSEAQEFIQDEIKAGVVKIFKAEDSSHQKAQIAEPGKPGIFVK